MRGPLPILLALLALFIPLCSALQENLAGIVDWHQALIGIPLRSSPPQFIDTDRGRAIVALTESKVLAVLEDNGDVRWRQSVDTPFQYWVQEEGEYRLTTLRCSAGRIADKVKGILLLTQSGLSLYDVSTGGLLWNAEVDVKSDPSTRWGWDVAVSEDIVMLLTDGARLTKLDRKTGTKLWTMLWPDTG